MDRPRGMTVLGKVCGGEMGVEVAGAYRNFKFRHCAGPPFSSTENTSHDTHDRAREDTLAPLTLASKGQSWSMLKELVMGTRRCAGIIPGSNERALQLMRNPTGATIADGDRHQEMRVLHDHGGRLLAPLAPEGGPRHLRHWRRPSGQPAGRT